MSEKEIKITAKEDPTGVLVFNLNDHYQKKSFLNAINADSMAINIDSMYDSVLRPYMRYNTSIINEGKEPSEEESKILERVLELLSEHFTDK